MFKYLHHREWILWAAVFLITGYLLVPNTWWHNPYSNVQVTHVYEDPPDWITVVANFNKNECTFVRLETFTITLGLHKQTTWVPVDTAERDYDRSVGEQQLVIRVYIGPLEPDQIGIRTRHNCDGTLVDKIFAIVNVEQVKHKAEAQRAVR